MKHETRNVNSKTLVVTISALALAAAFAFTTAGNIRQTNAAVQEEPAQLESIEEAGAPLAGPVQNTQLAENLAGIQAEPLLAQPTVLQPEAPVQRPAAAPEAAPAPAAPVVTEPETTIPEVPEVTEPETTIPEVPEVPEVTEPEAPVVEESISAKAISWLWKQLETAGTTANQYFANRAAKTTLDSAGPNWAPDVNRELEAAQIGISAGDSYGWRIWKGDAATGYNIFFTEDQLAGEAKGTVLEDVAKANTKELEAAEAAGDVEDAIVEGSAKVAVKTVEDVNHVKVEVSYIDGGSFVEDPEPAPVAEAPAPVVEAPAAQEPAPVQEAPAAPETVPEVVEG